MGPEERAGEAPVLFSDWTVSERQEQSWAASGQDRTAGVRRSHKHTQGAHARASPSVPQGPHGSEWLRG